MLAFRPDPARPPAGPRRSLGILVFQPHVPIFVHRHLLFAGVN